MHAHTCERMHAHTREQMRACYESLPGGLQGQLAPPTLAPCGRRATGAAGSVQVLPGPSRATGPAPACVAVWGGGLRWAAWVSRRLSEGRPEHVARLPAAPWLPRLAPLGCARQIPSSWDLPGTSLSEDGAPGRGVCVRTERVHPGATCSALVPSWGLGEGQVTHQPPKPSPAAPVLQDPVQGKAVPRQVGVGHPGAPCAWPRPSPSPRPAGGPCGLAGLSSAFGGLGWFWPWFLVAVRPWTSSSPPRGFGSLSAQWGSEG